MSIRPLRSTLSAPLRLLVILIFLCAFNLQASPVDHFGRFERSYWLHASLGTSLIKDYWKEGVPFGAPPTPAEIP